MSASDHMDKAEHDLTLSHSLLTTQSYLDWCITSLFYFALHCVDCYAKKHGVQTFIPRRNEGISAHRKRINYVNTHLKGLFTTYTRIYDRSMQSRYDPTYYQYVTDSNAKILYQVTKNCLVNMRLFPQARVP